MPQYKVKNGQQGFYGGLLYDSHGKRPILNTAKPLKPVPSWLEPIKHKSRQAERKAEMDAQAAADAEKAKTDEQMKEARNEIASVTFVDAPNAPPSGVETL